MTHILFVQADLKQTNMHTLDWQSVCNLRSRRLEVVGKRENGRARGRHARGEAPATQASLCVQETPDNSNLQGK